MTKNITIAYNEADEVFLMMFFKRMKIKTIPAKKVVEAEDRPLTREEHLTGLSESFRDVKRAIRGEIQLRSIYDVLAEMKAEQKQEVKL
jgi:hypothetical protein